MKQILIGKEGNQPFSIPDPNVSRKHAYLLLDEEKGTMYLVDNNSTNGTYIYNGNSFVRLFANQPVLVTFDTMMQLGPNTRFHVKKLFEKKSTAAPTQKQSKAEPQKKKVDIKHLHAISNRYNRLNVMLSAKTKKVDGLRTGTFIVGTASSFGGKVLASYLFGENVSDGLSWVIGLGLAILLIIILNWIINTNNEKIMKQKAENEHDYAVNYCCPVCHVSFKGKFYENILAEGCCPKCKTLYYDSSVKK